LAQQGWSTTNAFLTGAMVADTRTWLDERREALQPAGIGRAGTHRTHALRGDSTAWLDVDTPTSRVEQQWAERLEALRSHLNRSLFLGLRTVEAHVAVYPPGTGYARHLDRFRDDDARTVSLVAYLNTDWRPDDGGALRLYPADDAPAVDVWPEAGHAVAFLSADIPHEVLATQRERWSVAAWFRR
jgi:SM-20-related protein